MKAEEILLAALEKANSAERAAYLDDACGQDSELRATVGGLLHSLEDAGSFLEQPLFDQTTPQTIDELPSVETAGTVFGPYKLLEQIGEGGFGVVFMAEQQHPVRRKVALKVLKPGMDTRQVIARFEAERQALAIMDHPNIARVFDGGATASGHPYFVMELVKGVPITEFCDQNHLTPRQRLELFIPVCRAVQHAHQKGIIHRDLKPSNVLVSRHDTTPVVKVIDFGVAKALGQELTDKTLFTGVAQMIGTPLYMSPEQAGMSDLDVDTRSDIYSLGVLLYELLTSTTPFDKERLQNVGYDEIRRIIREEEPPKPSTRLSTLGSAAATVSANRRSDPRRLSRLVRGELDWIVMKALEKDRKRRYETAASFALDVQRYLADEPVLACPPSAAYRMRKFAQRNKVGLAVASLVLFFLVLLGSGIGWTVRDRAARQAKVAGQVELIFTEVDRLGREQKWPEALAAARRAEAAVTGGEADAATSQRVRAMLKELEFLDRLDKIRMQGATWVEGKFDSAGADRQYVRAFHDFGVDVEELAVETSIDRLKGHPALAIPVAAALDDWVDHRRQVSTDVAGWMRLVAVARGIDPEPLRDRVRATWRQPVSELRDELRRLADSIDIRAQHPATLVSLARALKRVKQFDSALRLLRNAHYVYPGDFWLNFELGHELYEQEDHEGAIRFNTAAVSIRPNSVAALRNLGNALRRQKKLDEAIAAYSKDIELDPKSPVAYFNLGVVLREQQKLDEAIAAFRKAIELDPKYASAYNSLGLALRGQHEVDEAIAAFRKAIELDPKNSLACTGLGLALSDQNKLGEAIATYRKAIELDPNNSAAYNHLGIALRDQKKLGEAIAAYRKAIELNPKYAQPHTNLGNALANQGKLDEAIAAYRKAIEIDPKSPGVYFNLGIALRKQKKLDEAIAAYRKAIEIDPKNSVAYFSLGNALCDQKKQDEGIAAYRKAIEIDPNHSATYNNLGLALRDKNKVDEAVAAFRKAIELDPKYGHRHAGLANALVVQNKFDEAITSYRTAIDCCRMAIELDPKDAIASKGLADANNGLAWLLATCRDPKFRDPERAVELAKRGVELSPSVGEYWNTLGVAHYRAGNWKAAIAALDKSMQLRKGGDGLDWFFLAMAHWQLGNQDEARKWYDKAIAWMDKNKRDDDELRRLRAEATELTKEEATKEPN